MQKTKQSRKKRKNQCLGLPKIDIIAQIPMQIVVA